MAKRSDSIIVESKEIVFDDQIKKQLGTVLSPVSLAEAQKNAQQVQAYKIIYKSGGHSVAGFVVTPREEGSFPCIIYNRGGNRNFSPIKLGHLFLKLAAMAQWGYVIIASQYSGGPGSEGKDEFGGSELEDILVLREVAAHYPKANIEKIGMYGASRGGMMAYLALTKVSWINAMVVIAGLADLARAVTLRPEMKDVLDDCFGGDAEDMKKRSGVNFAHKISKTSPILMMHGSADWRVSPLDSMDMSKKLLENKIPHRFILFEGSDHYLTEHKEESFRHTHEWFDRYLKNKDKLPNLEPHGE